MSSPLTKAISSILQLYPYKFNQWVKLQKSRVYNLWVRPMFKSVGDDAAFGKFEELFGAQYVSVGSHTSFDKHCYLTAWDEKNVGFPVVTDHTPEIIIGEHCFFGAHNHITASNSIKIGDGFLSGKWVTITDNSHGRYDTGDADEKRSWKTIRPQCRPISSKGAVVIEKNVWVGDHVVILPNVTIGEGAIIGANSVVTKSVPAFSIVAGNPAKVVKSLE